jgi:hypothetical protein
MRTIDLDEFTEAIAPAARLKDPLLAFAPRLPNTSFRHPLAQGLFADGNLMKLKQLLTGQGWTEVVIMLAHQVEDGIAKLVAVTAVAGTATLAGNKTSGTVTLVSLQEPMDLAPAEAQKPGSVNDTQSSIADLLDGFQPV